MTSPLLSIVIPARNARDHLTTLPGRLAPIRELDLPVEVILVVSSVTVDEQPALEILARELPGMMIVSRDEPLSVGSARNLGLEISSAPRIAFLDVDDAYDIPSLAHLVRELDLHQAKVGVGSYRVTSAMDAGKERDVIITGHPSRVVDLLHQHAAVWRYVFDRQWLIEQKLRFSDLPLGEDLIFLVDVDARRPTLHVTKRVHYTYIVDRPTQASGINATNEHRRMLLAELARRATRPNCPPDVRRLLFGWLIRSWAVGVRNSLLSQWRSRRTGRVLGSP